MSRFSRLDIDYIKAWCEEWGMDEQSRLKLLTRFAQIECEEDEWMLVDFMCLLAKDCMVRHIKSGNALSIEDMTAPDGDGDGLGRKS